VADKKQEALLYAAEHADWEQVVGNGGPPCFHVCGDDGLFCLRAERWAGHEADAYRGSHKFVSLRAMLAASERKEGSNG
jgi:hypothetical protein